MINKLLGWITATKGLWMLRSLNHERFNDILREANIYGKPQAKLIRFKGRTATFEHHGKTVSISGMPIDIIEVFFDENYSRLKVEGKVVADVGSSICDSGIYFLLHGARHLNGYEADEEALRSGRQNLGQNHLEDNATLKLQRVGSLSEIEGEVLKMDIEGGEHGIFANASLEEIRKFGQIIMEYHEGYSDIEAKLHEAGFETEVFGPTFKGRNGMMYAIKKKED